MNTLLLLLSAGLFVAGVVVFMAWLGSILAAADFEPDWEDLGKDPNHFAQDWDRWSQRERGGPHA